MLDLFSLLKRVLKQNKQGFINLEPVEELFVLALSSKKDKNFIKLKTLYNDVGDNELRRFSENEGCQSFIYSSLKNVLGESNVPIYWRREKEKVEGRINLYMQELDKIAEKFSSENISLLALKNTGIARGIYPYLAESPMGDIDVLINSKQFKEAHKIMIESGYLLDDRSPFKIMDYETAYRNGGTEYKCKLKDGSILWIELQWRAVSGRRILLDQEPSFNDLLEKSIPIDNSQVRLLSPEDNLLQVCLHTAKHSFVRAPGFRLHTDVERIVSAYDIDWELFLNKVALMRVKTPVYISLFIPHKLFKLEIPNLVLEELNFFPLKHLIILNWLKRVGFFGPHSKKWSNFGYIIFNILLFDSFKDLLRAIFPNKKSIVNLYGRKSKFKMIKIYINRLLALIFNRSKNI